MHRSLTFVLLACVVTLSLALAQTPANPSNPQTPSHQTQTTIEGLVRDIACPIQNLEATATHLSMKCLQECAKNGSPLVILTKEGELYLPISDKMPDTDQRQALMPFLGKYVRACGTVYERKGTRAIVIARIEELKDVPLRIEDQ
ncbi:MAG TPA: hypothetical protein VKB77_04145 [Terriglobales bacterium]|nr:hypothetical protein [Terriglobales bacterium]